MVCEIVNVVNLSMNGLPATFALSFNIKNNDIIIGSCQISIQSISSKFLLKDDQGNLLKRLIQLTH